MFHQRATSSTAKIASIEVVDIQGKVVQTINSPTSSTFEMAKNIANGTYFVKIVAANATYSNTIILNR